MSTTSSPTAPLTRFGAGSTRPPDHLPMRIVQITSDFGLGGVQKGAIVLGKHLGDLGAESYIVTNRDGPRLDRTYLRSAQPIVAGEGLDRVVETVVRLDPDVIHIHNSIFDEPMVEALAGVTKALLVSTPVFGRPPVQRRTLERTLTCCVGLYTHRRFCRWTGIPVNESFARGIFFAPITPFDPPEPGVMANPPPSGRPAKAGVTFGRVARPSAMKWHPGNPGMIDALLESDRRFRWVSVGWPEQMQRARLREKWGERFVNHEQIENYEELCRLILGLDVHFFASRYGECFSSSIGECAGLGVPTVALLHPLRDCGEIEQVVEHVTGVAAASAHELVEQARILGQDAGRLAELKRTTRGHAADHWHGRVVAQRLLELYTAYRAGARETAARSGWQQEADAFAQGYRQRLLGYYRSPLQRAGMAAALRATEQYWTHQLARRCLTVPRMIRSALRPSN